MGDDAAAWRGRVIDERYLVEDVLGRGGMGVVLRARHQFTGAMVALKVLREELAQDLDLQRRFLAEARASNAIAHPGIVEVVDAGRDATGALYLAMELLVGEALRQPISRGALSAPDVRRIGLELAEVLGAAHARGFVHRDLKPENVFLVAPSATVKLLDFGIAKVIASDLGSIGGRTAAGVVMGTPAYMAPEQLKDARAVDARADVWALGVMLYEMLAGRLPFRGATFEEIFIAIATADAAPISSILPGAPAPLDAFFARALARDPRYRFASSSELATAFALLPLGAVGTPVNTPPPPHSVIASGFASAPGLAPTEMGTPPPGVRAAPVTGPVPMLTPLPLAPPVATVTQPPVARAPRGHRVWLGAAIAVAVAAVAVAQLATHGAPRSALATTPSDAAVAVAPPIAAPPRVAPPLDAAVAVAPPSPPAPHDAPVATIPHAAPVAPVARVDPPRPARTTDEICTAGCAALTRCGIANPVCGQQCNARLDVQGCMSEATNCNRAAVCGFMIVCGIAPSGSGTCATISSAQGMCGRDAGCACRAAQNLAPGHALALAQYDGCAIGASVPCQGNLNCVNQRCASQRAVCVGQ